MQSAFLTAPHTTVVRGGGPHPVAAVRKRHIRRRLGKGGVSLCIDSHPHGDLIGISAGACTNGEERQISNGEPSGVQAGVDMSTSACQARRGTRGAAASHREPLATASHSTESHCASGKLRPPNSQCRTQCRTPPS